MDRKIIEQNERITTNDCRPLFNGLNLVLQQNVKNQQENKQEGWEVSCT